MAPFYIVDGDPFCESLLKHIIDPGAGWVQRVLFLSNAASKPKIHVPIAFSVTGLTHQKSVLKFERNKVVQ